MKSNTNEKVSNLNLIVSLRLILLLSIISISSQKIFGQTFPANFTPQIFMSGWTEVEGFRFDATGQIYVWEKAGKVWVVDTNGTKSGTPLLDISDEVGNWRDHGLNGFALDPNFRTNGYFYLFYTVDRHHLLNYGTPNYNASLNTYYNATIVRVTRYTANVATNFTTTVSGSRLVLIGENKKTGIPLLHESHSGGQLVFGTDGSLLISTGDGASYNLADGGSASGTYYTQALTDTIIRTKENVGAFRSQLVDCLNGKVLRINPATGDGLPSNPFYDGANPRAAKSRVWCLGLRNPFRMTLKPGSGSTDIHTGNPGVLYIGDVGWNTFEDLNVATGPAMNFGWPLFEGLTPASSYQALTVYNLDAVNPLYPSGSCTQQNFQFKQLCIQDTLTSNPYWPNPCNAGQQIPSTIPRFKHARPTVDWQHGTAHARTGTWSGSSASQIDLNNVASSVPGPVFAGNASVGGAWYTGSKYPAIYQNTYFNADYGQGWIKNFKFHTDNTPDSVKDFGSSLGAVVFLEYNPKDQLLYYVKYPSDIYKITYYSPINFPPTAVASQDVNYGIKPLTVTFTGSNSSDPENLPLVYSWNFGDGTPTSNLANPSHIYNPATSFPVTYTVTLTLTDNVNQIATATLIVSVNNTPPQVNITSFNNGDLFSMTNTTILPLTANVIDAESPDSLLTYTWQTFLHHNTHEHPEAPDNDKITYTTLTPVACDGNIYYYRIQLTVTDPTGLSTTVEGSLYPACDAPVAQFASDTSRGCTGLVINFVDQSSNLPDSLFWSFPGGIPSTSNAKNPSVTYNAGGIYNVTLIALSSRGADTITKNACINIGTKPSANIKPAGIDSMCSTGIKLLKANTGSNLLYQWINDGVNISGATGSTFNATAAGTYTVRVTDNLTGCSKISTTSKKIVIRPFTAVITPQSSTTFCNGDSVIIRANAGTFKYQWRMSGVIPGASSIDYIAKTAGSYHVKLTDAGGCQQFSNYIKVKINCREDGGIEQNNFAADVYPNPAFTDALLKVSMPEKGFIDIKIYDLLGNVISRFEKVEISHVGEFEFNLHTSALNAGVYFINVNNGEQSKDLKLIVAKN